MRLKFKKGKILLYPILLGLAIIFFSKSFVEAAGVVDSGHNMLLQSIEFAGIEGKAGVCSFCHLPHSASGTSMETKPEPGTYQTARVGYVGIFCSKCHNKTSELGGAPTLSLSVYAATDDDSEKKRNHPLIDNNTDIYGTAGIVLTGNSGARMGGTKQWISGWPATGRERRVQGVSEVMMECTSCHNVHSVTPGVPFDNTEAFTLDPNPNNNGYVGLGASGDFLRALPFDSNRIIGDTTENKPDQNQANPKQIFCEYCHIGRAQTGWGPYNVITVDNRDYSTHPVGIAGPAIVDNDKDQRRIYDKNSATRGWNMSIEDGYDSIFIRGAGIRVGGLGSNKVGHVGSIKGISSGRNSYDTTTGGTMGIVICQTCHQVHTNVKDTVVGQSHDGININNEPGFMFDSLMQDLLVEDNSATSGFNVLCEKCHSFRPFLRIYPDSVVTGDSSLKRGHPLRHNKVMGGIYPKTLESGFDTANQVTGKTCWDKDNFDGQAAIVIPADWPSGYMTGGSGNFNAPVCLTCHDVHGARPKTKLLRRIPLCARCHIKPLKKLGITHPVNVTLVNTDGATWPDQAALTLFTPPEYDINGYVIRNSEKSRPELTYDTGSSYEFLWGVMSDPANLVQINCDTCHDWVNGNIHYDVTKRRDPQSEVNPKTLTRYNKATSAFDLNRHSHRAAEDPNHNSELCVSCHTKDNFGYTQNGWITGLADAAAERDRIAGVAAQMGLNAVGANPAPWIREYPNIQALVFSGTSLWLSAGTPADGTWTDMEPTYLSRIGTHATQLHVVDAEGPREDDIRSTHGQRNGWVYSQMWGDTTGGGTLLRDPNYAAYPEGCYNMLSGKRSKWGQTFDSIINAGESPQDTTLVAKIICQSCHTPHSAAAGLVEYNTGGIESERTSHTALLLATQAESFMCRTCHWNGGLVKHPVNQPSNVAYRAREDDTYYWVMDSCGGPSGMRKSDKRHQLKLTREQESTRVSDSTSPFYLRTDDTTAPSGGKDPGGFLWRVNNVRGPMPPTNYTRAYGSLRNPGAPGLPGTAVTEAVNNKSMLTCDSCHAPHAAGTPMGTYCLEGHDSTVPTTGEVERDDQVLPPPSILKGAGQPSWKNDAPTCILCHVQ